MQKWGVVKKDINESELEKLQAATEEDNNSLLNAAITEAWKNSPVHINVPFEEPLYDLLDEVEQTMVAEHHELTEVEPQTHWQEIITRWKDSRKKLVIVGVQHPGVLNESILNRLAADPEVVVLTETTSNMRRPEFINSIDSVIAPIELAADREEIFNGLQPDLLITFGGLIVSKKIKAFLRKWQPGEHWHLDEKKAYDTFLSLSRHIKTNPAAFFENIPVPQITEASTFKKNWTERNTQQKELRHQYLRQIEYSDLLSFHLIMKAIPKNYMLQLANSSTVRYTQLFDLPAAQQVFCNRGTSGIDGSTSTAVGAALCHENPTLLISGDLSFFYDINGLWNGYVRSDFRIIVINNGGGGIFRILPGRKSDANFERFFETTHDTRIDGVCDLYDMEHLAATNTDELVDALKDFFSQGDRPKLLEVKTPRTLNDKVLLGYFEFISSNLYS